MPKRPPHPCAEPGCPALVYQGSRCPAHQLPGRPKRAKAEQRPTAAQRGYDYEWQRIRTAYLARHPYCADPYHRHPGYIAKGAIVDHVKPKRQGGTNAERNLQTLCFSCHEYKKARDGSHKRGVRAGGVKTSYSRR